jgi:hypothetical protein
MIALVWFAALAPGAFVAANRPAANDDAEPGGMIRSGIRR